MSSQYDRERRAERLSRKSQEHQQARAAFNARHNGMNNVDEILESSMSGRRNGQRDSEALRYFYQMQEL